jgi:NADH:ubiquinone oxidoreductase subunit 4 (subunit M)
MGKVYCIYLIESLLELTLFYLFFSLFFSVLFWYFSQTSNFQSFFRNVSVLGLIKINLLVSMLVVCVTSFLLTWLYYIYQHTFNNYIIYFNTLDNLYFFDIFKINVCYDFFIHFNLDGFGLVLLNLALFVGFIALLSLDTRFYWKNVKFIFLCNVLLIVVFIFALVNDIVTFFLMYESLLIPSFLLVYYVTPYRKGVQASIYFLIWTQLGSFLVLCGVGYIVYATGLVYFSHIKAFTFTFYEIYFLYFCFFFGFGFKIPIWPFHHWLTKTHVEAPSGFSIFLSGFLVKSAVFGFYKLSNLLGGEIDTTFFSLFAFMGALDASYKMWAQTDLKKLVAYGTIQEMSMVYLVLCWGDSFATYGSLIFCITHSFLSALLFYLVDCVQRRYRTRSIVQLNGVLLTNPNLGIVILITCLVYAGLPGTMKFITEFYILSGLVEALPYSIILLIFSVNYVGTIGFCKIWFNVVFGMSTDKHVVTQGDLSFKEIFIIFFCFINFFFFGQIVNIIL